MVSSYEYGDGKGRRRRGRGNFRDSSNNGTDVESSNGRRSEKIRKLLLGFGFWVQGLRCFPWLGVNFFLKDGLKLDPSSLQMLQNSANLPMVAKPFYGILSDSYYIFGQHRIPYIAVGGIYIIYLLGFCSPLLIGYLTFNSFVCHSGFENWLNL